MLIYFIWRHHNIFSVFVWHQVVNQAWSYCCNIWHMFGWMVLPGARPKIAGILTICLWLELFLRQPNSYNTFLLLIAQLRELLWECKWRLRFLPERVSLFLTKWHCMFHSVANAYVCWSFSPKIWGITSINWELFLWDSGTSALPAISLRCERTIRVKSIRWPVHVLLSRWSSNIGVFKKLFLIIGQVYSSYGGRRKQNERVRKNSRILSFSIAPSFP
jgi:hypothetical protein